MDSKAPAHINTAFSKHLKIRILFCKPTESHPMVKKWKKRTGQKTSALFIMCHSHDKGRLMGIKAVGYVIDEFTV